MTIMEKSKPTLIILAGGKSSRMGRDKALLKFKNKTFVEIIYDNLKDICSEVIISSNNPKVKIAGVKTVEDDIKDIGPMGGLFTCLKLSKTELSIVVSVDTPFVTKKTISKIALHSDGYDITFVKQNNKAHPLIGIYRKNIIELLKSEIDSEKYKVMQMIKKSNHQIITINDNFKDEFFNINTPEDFGKISFVQ